MKYLFDSDAVSLFFATDREPYYGRLRRKVAQLSDADQLFVSVISIFEFQYSLANAPKERETYLKELFPQIDLVFETVPLEGPVAPVYGRLKAKLKRLHGKTSREMQKHNIDLMIASTALHEGAVLITGDKGLLGLAEELPELKVENWLEA